MNDLFDLHKPAPSLLAINRRKIQVRKEIRTAIVSRTTGSLFMALFGYALIQPYAADPASSYGMNEAATMFWGFTILLSGLIASGLSASKWYLDPSNFDRSLDFTEADANRISDLSKLTLPQYAIKYIQSVAELNRVITNFEWGLLRDSAHDSDTANLRQIAMSEIVQKTIQLHENRT